VKICPKDNLEFTDSMQFCSQCGSPLRELDPSVDRIVGGSYKILHRIGEGWAGYVCKATHVMIGKDVALKVISTDEPLSKDQVEQFRNWARAVTNLTHANIGLIHDLWLSERKTIYIATELIRGQNLRQVLTEEGPMPGEFFLAVMRQICHALRAAHDQQIFHGDLKPTNVMLTSGDNGDVIAKVVDFGASRVLEIITSSDETLAQELSVSYEGRRVLADPEYASPEQIEGKPLDARSDVYSLGVMMYEMLTGARPFRGSSPEKVLQAHLSEAPCPMREFKPQLQIPKFIERAVMKALEKAPRQRQQSIASLLDELDAEITESEAASRPEVVSFWNRVRRLIGSAGATKTPQEPETELRPSKDVTPPSAVLDSTQSAVLLRIAEGEVVQQWQISSLPLRIGRSARNDVVLDDHSVSRRHARILMQDNRLLILDENSSNGTFVNDKRTRLKKLHHGDEIQVGDIFLRFELKPTQTSADGDAGTSS